MEQIADSLGASNSSSVFNTRGVGDLYFEFIGTFDGSTVALEVSSDNATWRTFNAGGVDLTYTAPGFHRLSLPRGRYFRLTTNATGSPVIDIHVDGVNYDLVEAV